VNFFVHPIPNCQTQKYTGAVTVSEGISKATGFVGKSLATGGHWGYNQYKKTDAYAEREAARQQHPPKTEPTKTDATLLVGKSTVGALGNVWSGLCMSSKMVGGEVRDTTTEMVAHKKGKEHAEATYKTFNTTGAGAIGAVNTWSVVTTYYHLIPDIAIGVGVGALQYDPYKQDVLHGDPWVQGWISYEGRALEKWKSMYTVVRSYSIAWYSSPKYWKSSPVDYIPLSKIVDVKRVPFEQTKHEMSIQIIAKNRMLFCSFCCDDMPGWSSQGRDYSKVIDEWINTILCLASVQQSYQW